MKGQGISDILLERYLLNEVSASEKRRVEDFMMKDPDISKRIEMLKQSNHEIIDKYNPETVSSEIEKRYRSLQHGKEKKQFVLIKYLSIPAIASAAALIFVLFSPLSESDLNFIKWIYSPDTTRIKGNVSDIFIYRKKGKGVELLKNGSHAGKGDLLQITYISRKNTYGIIFSIDGRKKITLLFPEEKNGPEKLELNKKTSISHSYELDDAPGFERFFFLTCSNSIDIDRVFLSAEKLIKNPVDACKSPLDLDKSIRQVSILLVKE